MSFPQWLQPVTQGRSRSFAPLTPLRGAPKLAPLSDCLDCQVQVMEKSARAPRKTRMRFPLSHNLCCCGLSLAGCGEWEGEGRSVGKLLSYLSGFGIQSDEQFVSQGDADDLGWFSGGTESLLKSDEVRFVAAYHAGNDEQDLAHGRRG